MTLFSTTGCGLSRVTASIAIEGRINSVQSQISVVRIVSDRGFVAEREEGISDAILSKANSGSTGLAYFLTAADRTPTSTERTVQACRLKGLFAAPNTFASCDMPGL